jgi:hypothetical protein
MAAEEPHGDGVAEVADDVPEFSDLQLELIRRLAEGRTLTEALNHPERLHELSRALARPAVNRVSNDLSRFMGVAVSLAEARGRTGTFATAQCRDLAPALATIALSREAAHAAQQRQYQLEALQLATCLDKNPLRIGAYQAHAERFLATAAQLMADHFPWVETRIIVLQNRERADNSRGEVRANFENRAFDVMLVPRDSAEQTRLEYVYTYSFRVIGTRQKLAGLQDENGVIDRLKLKGERLIVGPKNSSSRKRLRDLLLDVDIDIEKDNPLLEEEYPSSMRMRAETGEGVAVMSDEYKMVGSCEKSFPFLGVGLIDGRQELHKVEMGLLMRDGAAQPRHRAFRFVVRELVGREQRSARAAVQD